MKNEIKKWENMYQETTSNSMNMEVLIRELNNLETNARLERNKLISISIVLVIASGIYFYELRGNYFYLMSYAFMVLAISIKLGSLYKSRYNLIEGTASFNNSNFVKKLKDKLKFNTIHLFLFMFVTFLALNTALLGLYEKGTIFNFPFTSENRRIIHLSTIGLFVFAFIVNYNKLNSSRKRISKLMDEMEKID